MDNVDLSLVGREFLNDLIGNSLDFGLDLLTKKYNTDLEQDLNWSK